MLLQRQKSLCATEHFACLPQGSLLVSLFSVVSQFPEMFYLTEALKKRENIECVSFVFHVALELFF